MDEQQKQKQYEQWAKEVNIKEKVDKYYETMIKITKDELDEVKKTR